MNKLTHIKNFAKRNYYESLIRINNKDSSQSWSITKKKKKKYQLQLL